MRLRTNRAVGVALLGAIVAAGIAGAVVAGSSGGGRSSHSSSGAATGSPGVADSAAANGTGKSAGSTVPIAKSVVRTASISVRVPRVGVADQVRTVAEGVGGSVDSDNRTSGGADPLADAGRSGAAATLTLAVPPDRLGEVLGRVAALGAELSRTESSQDVTGQVADVKSRLDSARRSIDRVRVLFSNATRIGDIIALESELATREADLESLQAQQRALDAQTSMAHVTVQLTTTGTATPVKHDRSGFVGGLSRGWDGFVKSGSALLTVLGVVAPFALLLAAVGGAVVIARRRRHRASPPPPVPDAA
jgi:hypothetical protein